MSKRYIPVPIQVAVTERAKERCEYCHCPMAYSAQPFVFEHIIPVSREGASDLNNLALACGGCNGHKYNKVEASDPVSLKIVPLFNPRQHQWSDHFAWDDEFTGMIGLTATGRATVDALKMNRPGVVNIRTVLVLAGKHPPV